MPANSSLIAVVLSLKGKTANTLSHTRRKNSQIQTGEQRLNITWMDTRITSAVMMVTMPDGGIITIVTAFKLVLRVSMEEIFCWCWIYGCIWQWEDPCCYKLCEAGGALPQGGLEEKWTQKWGFMAMISSQLAKKKTHGRVVLCKCKF